MASTHPTFQSLAPRSMFFVFLQCKERYPVDFFGPTVRLGFRRLIATLAEYYQRAKIDGRLVMQISWLTRKVPSSMGKSGLRQYLMTCLVFQAACSGFSADPQVLQKQLDTRIKPLLTEHCTGCHGGAEPDAGVSLEHFDTPKSFLKGNKLWMKAVQKMELGEMPPKDSPEMPEADRKALTQWIRSTIEDFQCGLTPNPGQVTLRRLNASEYRNTVRDLVGVDYEPAENFPADDVGYGFDNIGDVLTLPPLLMEKYLLAAEEISRKAILTPRRTRSLRPVTQEVSCRSKGDYHRGNPR